MKLVIAQMKHETNTYSPVPTPLLAAAQARDVPMNLLDVRSAGAPPEYRHALVLCRADQHVAWRGDSLPADPGELIERLRGAALGRSAPGQSS